MSQHGEMPVCLAVLLCDLVIEDKRTNNKTFVNAFNAIGAASLPAHHPRMAVVASVTSLLGSVPIELVLTAPNGANVIRLQGDVESGDPLSVLDLVFDIVGCPLDEVGTYTIDLYARGRQIGSRRFQVFLT